MATTSDRLKHLADALHAKVTVLESSSSKSGASSYTVRLEFPAAKKTVAAFDALLVALDEAERTPGIEFVSLKWFRDGFLKTSAIPEAERQTLIAKAIEAGYMRISKFQNPKAPQFPTTGIRLNRQSPVVLRALGGVAKRGDAEDFAPVRIKKGKPLSQTIVDDRR